MRASIALSLLLSACAPKDGAPSDDTSVPVDDTGVAPVTCEAAPPVSSCGDAASVVRTVVRAGADGPTTGDLVVYLTHYALGQETQGGYYHTDVLVEDVDLSEGPLTLELDMCDGGEMWSAEWGDYNLLAILDQDGSNRPNSFDSDRLPEDGEPSARVGPFTLALGAESPCYDLTLDCLNGRSCTSY